MRVCGMVWVLGAKAGAGWQGPELLVDMQEYDYSLDMWSLGSMFAGEVCEVYAVSCMPLVPGMAPLLCLLSCLLHAHPYARRHQLESRCDNRRARVLMHAVSAHANAAGCCSGGVGCGGVGCG